MARCGDPRSKSEGEPAPPVLHRDPLQGGEGLDSRLAVEAADSGALLAAERDEGLVVDRAVVHMEHAGVDLLGEGDAPLDVTGVDGTAQAVRRVVDEAYGLLLAVEGDEEG